MFLIVRVAQAGTEIHPEGHFCDTSSPSPRDRRTLRVFFFSHFKGGRGGHGGFWELTKLQGQEGGQN